LEGYEGTIAAGESDMGVHHKNAVSVMCSVGGSCPVTVERNQYISPRDAEVLLLGTLETTDADDTE